MCRLRTRAFFSSELAAESSSKPKPMPSQASSYVTQACKDFREAISEGLEERKSASADEKKHSSVVKKSSKALHLAVCKRLNPVLLLHLLSSVEDGCKVELIAVPESFPLKNHEK